MEPKAADWYPDPSGEFKHRYWNGQKWTQHVAQDGKALTDAGWPREGTTGSGDGSAGSSAPVFEDSDDATRWKLVQSVQASLAAMMDTYQRCFETAENVEGAYGMANAEVVNGVRQHEISKQTFRTHAEKRERELESLLGELRTATLAAQNQWKDLVFLLPGSENDVMKIANWCMSNGVDSEVVGSIMGNGAFLYTDFGITRQSFWTENERVIAVMNAARQ